jgi:penicillin-binding protein 2
MCIIANHGYFYTPHIIKKVGKENLHQSKFKEKHYTDIDPKYYDVMIDGMQDVVDIGTAAGSKIKGITFCGKTGTAQNPHGKDHSLFVAFAPRENPKIAIGIMVENGGWGASWAAPIASLMIEKYLNDSIATPARHALEKRMLEGVIIMPKK